jgi:hypothetical protein
MRFWHLTGVLFLEEVKQTTITRGSGPKSSGPLLVGQGSYRKKMREHRPTTTVAIVGANTVVESALAQLLEGEGYSIRLLKSSSTRVVEEQLDGLYLVVLSPGLTSGACEALLGALRSTPQSSTANPRIRVIALCTRMREAPLDGEAVRSVPWPIPFERLVREIEAMLAGRPPSGYTQTARTQTCSPSSLPPPTPWSLAPTRGVPRSRV